MGEHPGVHPGHLQQPRHAWPSSRHHALQREAPLPLQLQFGAVRDGPRLCEAQRRAAGRAPGPALRRALLGRPSGPGAVRGWHPTRCHEERGCHEEGRRPPCERKHRRDPASRATYSFRRLHSELCHPGRPGLQRDPELQHPGGDPELQHADGATGSAPSPVYLQRLVVSPRGHAISRVATGPGAAVPGPGAAEPGLAPGHVVPRGASSHHAAGARCLAAPGACGPHHGAAAGAVEVEVRTGIAPGILAAASTSAASREILAARATSADGTGRRPGLRTAALGPGHPPLRCAGGAVQSSSELPHASAVPHGCAISRKRRQTLAAANSPSSHVGAGSP
mmetsp:Transcript_173880/g.557321  ORF Transcript_173880/g.557321 Transcript_173880/m.557321 type:complete len:337 (-) Transcript_173880:543-1553(-)